MKLEVIGRNVQISKIAQNGIEKKISRLTRYLPTIAEGKIEISREKAKLPEQRFTVQVTLDSRDMLIRAQERAEDVRTATDKVTDALTSRIERYKSKLYDKSRGISLARQRAIIKVEEPEIPKVVKTKHFLVKPMLEDEAVNQMELLGHDFFLFINAETGNINLLYRRKDDNYGLIEPEVG